MKAMVLHALCKVDAHSAPHSAPLVMAELPKPIPQENEILIRVATCGVCHTELDEIEGRTPPPFLPVVLGHQVIGYVESAGSNAKKFKAGDRVGVAWIHSACGVCKFCLSGRENLCEAFSATGRDCNGGYAEYMTALEHFAFAVPDVFTDAEAAPLLCAGAIGYRSLKLTGIKDGQKLGLTGFGASGHLVLKMVLHLYPQVSVYVFARSEMERAFAIELGAIWAGDTHEQSPQKLDCIIDTTPAWMPVVEALANLESGGRLVINAIRKEEQDKSALMQLSYPQHLWLEKEVKSVANITREDVTEFLQLAADMGFKPEVEEYALADANRALVELKNKQVCGAKVLRINDQVD